MSARIKGHDYRSGVDLEMSGAEWRALLSAAYYTRRIGNGVLAYQRENGHTRLAFEVYDDNGAVHLRRPGVKK
jgi:hypothetical protein